MSHVVDFFGSAWPRAIKLPTNATQFDDDEAEETAREKKKKEKENVEDIG